MPTNETQLVNLIQESIRRDYPQAWVFNVVGHPYQRSGVPDLLVCLGGRLVGLEVKYQRPAESERHALGRASALQRKEIEGIRRAGGAAHVVTSVEQALAILHEVTSL